jgi:hypothetical protein
MAFSPHDACVTRQLRIQDLPQPAYFSTGGRPPQPKDRCGCQVRLAMLYERRNTHMVKIPAITSIGDFHGVTRWQRVDDRWQGLTFRTLGTGDHR